jgi:antagonist of KipI
LQGSRCYLAVRGGIDINDVLSAKTTHLTSKIGGVDGRSLKKDDVLIIGEEQKLLNPIKINEMLDINMSKLLIIKGLQSNYISKSTWKIFLNQEYIVSNLSNRMGIRLEGNSLKLANKNEIITEGVPLGAIQLPSNGYPIISFVEHQTTGGYPKIANVISSELHKVGQLKPGDKFQFELVSLEEAEALRHEREFYIKRMVDHG